MILQRLATYYDRLLSEGQIEAPGFQEKEIPWIVEVNRQGAFVALTRTGDDERPKRFRVPSEVKRASNIVANLLWDKPDYVFGAAKPSDDPKQKAKEIAKAPQRHAAFVKRLRDLPEAALKDEGVKAILAFLENGDFSGLQAADGWAELVETGGYVSFRLPGDEDIVCNRAAVRAAITAVRDAEDPVAEGTQTAICLVTGERTVPARLHPSIKSVRGAQTSGANLVSFNRPAFTSHGWDQGNNAPVGERTAQAYVAALNRLLDRENRRHQHVEGDSTFVFWASAKTRMEDRFAHLLGGWGEEPTESDGTPVRATFDSIRKGLKPLLDDKTPFHVLGLAPNAARLAVRFWHEGSVADVAGRIAAHFDDLDIDGLWEKGYPPGLWSLLGAAAIDGKPNKLQDNLRGKLAADLVEAILAGRPYPQALFARVIGRCRAERAVWPVRAALIKATLNRRTRILGSTKKEISVSLDPDNPNPAYRLGRLFAVLEGIQRNAQPNINATIRDRYFSAASMSPRSSFGELMRLKNAHLRKLQRSKRGLAIHFERLIDQIVGGFPATGFPAYLELEDQGRFIIGYHHQRNHRSKTEGQAPSDATALPNEPDTDNATEERI